LSIAFSHLWRPLLRTADVRDVDAIQQHGQLRGVELRAERFVMEGR
jgi:hypothetical protein